MPYKLGNLTESGMIGDTYPTISSHIQKCKVILYHLQKRAALLVFEGGWLFANTNFENKQHCSFSTVVDPFPGPTFKTSGVACFRRWLDTTTLPPSKTSHHARFQRWLILFPGPPFNHPRKQATALVFDGRWSFTTTYHLRNQARVLVFDRGWSRTVYMGTLDGTIRRRRGQTWRAGR
jgi:hypothetical protein